MSEVHYEYRDATPWYREAEETWVPSDDRPGDPEDWEETSEDQWDCDRCGGSYPRTDIEVFRGGTMVCKRCLLGADVLGAEECERDGRYDL